MARVSHVPPSSPATAWCRRSGAGVGAFWDGLRGPDAPPSRPSAGSAPTTSSPRRLPRSPIRATPTPTVPARSRCAPPPTPWRRPGSRPDAIEPARLGVALGTTLGGMELFEPGTRRRRAGSPPAADLRRVPYYAPAARLARGDRRARAGRDAAARVRLGDRRRSRWRRTGCAPAAPTSSSRAAPICCAASSWRASTASTRRPPTRVPSTATGAGSSWAKGAAVAGGRGRGARRPPRRARAGAHPGRRRRGRRRAHDRTDREGGGVVRAIGAALARCRPRAVGGGLRLRARHRDAVQRRHGGPRAGRASSASVRCP